MNFIGYMYRAPAALLLLNIQGDYSTDGLFQPITYSTQHIILEMFLQIEIH